MRLSSWFLGQSEDRDASIGRAQACKRTHMPFSLAGGSGVDYARRLCLDSPLLFTCGLRATWLSITSTHGSSHAHNLSMARTELCKTHLGRPIC